MKNKIIFWSVLSSSFVLIILTIFPGTDISYILNYPTVISNISLRLFGLILYTLLFWQIMSGAYIEKWISKLGGWFFNFHILLGIIIYTFTLLHITLFLLSRYFLGIGLDPIFVFLGFCVYCKSKLDFYYTLGRVSFWLLTLAVLAGFFRSANTFMRANWRKFHIVNYLVFLISGVHGFLLGTDFTSSPFFYFAIIANILVIYTVIKKLPSLISFYRKWLNS